MRLLAFIILALFVAAGVMVGALNAGSVAYDFAFFQLTLPTGAALLGALVVGWLLGGLTAWLGVSLTARRRRRELQRGSGKGATPRS